MVRDLGKMEAEIVVGCAVAKADDARLSLTQSDDPLSGGHLALGVSKTPRAASRERGTAKDISGQKHIG